MKKIILIFMLTLSLLLLTSCGDKESQLFEFGLRIENSCSVDGLKSEDATSINIPITYDNRQVKYIGRNAFEGNEKLISVIIPEGVEYIESYAFKGCSNLENISLPNSIKEIEYGAFEGCDKLQFNIHENGKYLGNTDNPHVALISGIEKNVSTFKVNESCVVIYNKALSGFTKLKTLDMPYSIKYIGSSAFEGCSTLETFLVPNYVEHFDASWLYHCNSLKTITISANVKTVAIDYMWGCNSFSEFNVYSTNSTFAAKDGVLYSKDLECLLAYPRAKKGDSFSIPSYVERIATYAFNGCDYLKSISMWSTIQKLGSSAIINCDSLHTVRFNGTTSEWVKLDNANLGWDHSFSITKVYCSNGTITRSKA